MLREKKVSKNALKFCYKKVALYLPGVGISNISGGKVPESLLLPTSKNFIDVNFEYPDGSDPVIKLFEMPRSSKSSNPTHSLGIVPVM